jgi:hypothetical protein
MFCCLLRAARLARPGAIGLTFQRVPALFPDILLGSDSAPFAASPYSAARRHAPVIEA